MKRLLIRADDLGYSDGVNCGIARSVNEGIIRSVGVMVNMPEVENGLRMLHADGLCLGQHTNISSGKPLCDPKDIPSLMGEGGLLKPTRAYHSPGTDTIVLDEVILEIEAQYRRFCMLVGEKPGYLEGHAVFHPVYEQGLEIVAKRHGVKFSGLPKQGEPMRVGNTDVLMSMDSMQQDYVPFASLKRNLLEAPDGACVVFVCHPGYLDAYILDHSSLTTPRPREVAMLTDPEVANWLDAQNIQRVTYYDL